MVYSSRKNNSGGPEFQMGMPASSWLPLSRVCPIPWSIAINVHASLHSIQRAVFMPYKSGCRSVTWHNRTMTLVINHVEKLHGLIKKPKHDVHTTFPQNHKKRSLLRLWRTWAAAWLFWASLWAAAWEVVSRRCWASSAIRCAFSLRSTWNATFSNDCIQTSTGM